MALMTKKLRFHFSFRSKQATYRDYVGEMDFDRRILRAVYLARVDWISDHKFCERSIPSFSLDSATKFRKTSMTAASGQYWWHPGRIHALGKSSKK